MSAKDRIRQLETAIPILEDHLDKFSDQTSTEALEFISEHLSFYKRELKIRKDYSDPQLINIQIKIKK